MPPPPRAAPPKIFSSPDDGFPKEEVPRNSDGEMPPELSNHLQELEKWAVANRKDARRDAIAFWILKVPAILVGASAGVWAHFGFETVSVIAGAVAGVCVLIDGILRRGMLRNVHLRGFHDIRILSSNMVAEWRSRDVTADSRQTAREIIRAGEKERRRIAAYIRDAETTMMEKSGP